MTKKDTKTTYEVLRGLHSFFATMTQAEYSEVMGGRTLYVTDSGDIDFYQILSYLDKEGYRLLINWLETRIADYREKGYRMNL